MSRCVVICSSPDYNIDVVKKEIYPDDYVICADGGFDIANEAGISADLAIGDFDSLRGKIEKDIPKVVLPVEKDETDTMYAVKEGLKRGFDNFVLLCATGGRIDHTIANFNVISYLSSIKKKNVIIEPSKKIFSLENGSVEISGTKESLVSVFPFNCDSSRISYKNMAYPLTQETLYCNSTRGISNFMLTESGSIIVHSGSVIVVIDSTCEISWSI